MAWSPCSRPLFIHLHMRILEQLWQEQIYNSKFAPAKAAPKSAHPGAVCCGANKVLATLKKIVFPYYSPNESYLGFRQQLVDKVWVRPLLSGISYTIVSYFNIKGKFGLFFYHFGKYWIWFDWLLGTSVSIALGNVRRPFLTELSSVRMIIP